MHCLGIRRYWEYAVGIERYCDRWNIPVNIKKTKLMKTKWSNEIIIYYKGEKIKEMRYLGFVISANASLSEVVEELAVSTRKALQTLLARARELGSLPVFIMCHVFI